MHIIDRISRSLILLIKGKWVKCVENSDIHVSDEAIDINLARQKTYLQI
jgi:hypothetical protein